MFYPIKGGITLTRPSVPNSVITSKGNSNICTVYIFNSPDDSLEFINLIHLKSSPLRIDESSLPLEQYQQIMLNLSQY